MPRFTDRTIDQIKTRLTISDVMQNYAFVENRGGAKWVKCPFHGNGTERTASCKLDDAKGTFYCFGCHEHGDIFRLIQLKEGVDFTSSVEMLAKRAGVVLEEDNSRSSAEARKAREEKENLYALYSKLASSFHYILLSTPEGGAAREYLEKRKISSEMIETFNLGYAPKDRTWLHRFLLKQGYSPEFLAQSGLFSQKNSSWPLFSNRLMFPIRDRQGRTIAFSGRDLSGDEKAPKYINSPETRIYMKKENFFGLYEAKNTISRGETGPILCEGNFDVVAMHQAGFTSAVASLGTSFTTEQCSNMKKWYPMVKCFNLLFDSDEAGQTSTLRAIDIINRNGLEQRVHVLKSAKDASELLERDGVEGVRREFESYVSGFDYLVKNSLNRYDVKNARGKVDFIASLSQYLSSCTSEVERDSYILQLSSLLGVSDESIKEDLRRSGKKEWNGDMEEEVFQPSLESAVPADLFAVLYLANHRDIFPLYRKRLSFGDLEDVRAQKIYMALENAMRDGTQSDTLFLSYLSDEGIRTITGTSFVLEEYNRENGKALEEAVDRIRLRSLERKQSVLLSQLKLVSSLDQDEAEELLVSKMAVDSEISELKKRLLGIEGKDEKKW